MARNPALTDGSAVGTVAYVYRQDVYNAARDLVSDYRGDYVFCELAGSKYVICYDITGLAINGNLITFDSATVYQLDVGRTVENRENRFDGTITGLGSFSGRVGSDDCLFSSTYSVSSITISNQDDSIVYCNKQGFPKLHEGVIYYDFAEVLLLCTCCVFVLFDLIFRRIYIKG